MNDKMTKNKKLNEW